MFSRPHLKFYYATRDAIYAALYVINWQQLAASLDYFNDADNGLFVHYWSLAVEEQFYLFLTFVFAVALGWWRFVSGKMLWTSGQVAAALLLFLGAVSFIANLVLTPQVQPVAFFGTHARIWELCLGSGVALLQRHGWTPGAPARSVLAWLGTAAIALTFLFYDAQDIAYPGIYATLPTIGTAFYILAGINAKSETLPIPLRLRISPDSSGYRKAVRPLFVALAGLRAVSDPFQQLDHSGPRDRTRRHGFAGNRKPRPG